MYTISVAMQKGGTGKTTTAWAIAGELNRRGQRVLSIDLDAQGNLSMIMGGKQDVPSIYDVLIGAASPSTAIQTTEQGDLMRYSPKLAMLPYQANKGDESRLRDVLEAVRDRYDYVILDCPPTLGPQVVTALTASDGVLIPVEGDVFTLRALIQIRKTIAAVREQNPALKVLGLAPTRHTSRTVLSRTISPELENQAGELGTKVLHPVRPCIAVQEAQAQAMSLQSYAPKCNASKDYAELVDQILEQTGKGRKRSRKVRI